MHWYAVRVTYSRELFFKEYLDAAGIENYIPMRYEYVVRKERRLRKLVPAVHNLVFVRSTRERMDEIKNEPGMNIPIPLYHGPRNPPAHRHPGLADAQLHRRVWHLRPGCALS